MIYENALSFDLVKYPLFKKALKSISEYCRGLQPPSYHETMVTYLKKEIEHVNEGLEKYKSEWSKTGCTLIFNGWTDGRERLITNFLVNSSEGTVFIKSVGTSSFIKDAQKLFQLYDSIVDEIRKDNVVQVVTTGASTYMLVGRVLEEKMPQFFWSPYATHSIDLMFMTQRS